MEQYTFITYIEGLKDETPYRVRAFSKEDAAAKTLFKHLPLTEVDKIYVERWEKFRANEIVGVFNKDLKEFYGPWPQTSKEKVSDENSKNSPNNSTK